MKEVIARRFRDNKIYKAIGYGITLLIFGVLCVLCIVLYPETDYGEFTEGLLLGIILGLYSLILLCCYIVSSIRQAKKDIYISLKEGTLYFQDGSTCPMSSVTDVQYSANLYSVSKKPKVSDNKLSVKSGEKIYSYFNVENGDKAASRLRELMEEYKNSNGDNNG